MTSAARSGRSALAAAALLAAASTAPCARAGDVLPKADAARLEQRILALGRFGANPGGGVSRVAFSAADIAGREYIQSLMREAGLAVRIDAAGNLIGRRDGRSGPAFLDSFRGRDKWDSAVKLPPRATAI